MNELAEIPQFEGKNIRRVQIDGDWHYNILDVIEVLTESNRPRKYWNDLKTKELKKNGVQLSEFCGQYKFTADNGRKYNYDIAANEGLFRIIQAIPSPKAEPFKQWLAKVGAERVEEIEDPMKAIDRAKDHYRKKGYSEEWITRRMQSKGVRDILTEEWEERGIKDPRQFGALTNEIHKGAFDLTVKEHKDHKSLKRHNLRDHMTLTELAITILGEASTVDIANSRDAQGFVENKEAAKDGGKIAGDARRQIEAQTGKKVVSKQNFLKRLKGKD